MDGTKKVVLLLFQNFVVGGDAGRHQFGDAALDEGFGEFGIFQLVADGHAVAGAYQFGKVGVEGMVRKTGEVLVGGGSV